MASRFASALRTVNRLFQGVPTTLVTQVRFALIGGLAVSAWGRVRATQDIDILADSIPSPLQEQSLRNHLGAVWEARGCIVEWRVGMSDDPIPLLLHLVLPPPARAAVDVLWAWKAWQREALTRVCTVRVARTTVAVLHPEDLILMKLEAGGPLDLLDVESILLTNPPELYRERLIKAATKLRVRTVLNRCLQQISKE
jgi:hypothetical protein